MKKNLLLATTFVAGLITMGVAQLPSNTSASAKNLNGYMTLDTVPQKDTVPGKSDSSSANLTSFNSYMAKDTVPQKDTVPSKPDSSSVNL
ncbi:hypothetical protein OCK74_06960 [Chitinophagaceae bacterium LB-8]|uniref:Uncharacterized protein n=1 Tax=Paraflavisolibacter caeni TaxID=2982496 RepID=A0A9X2XUQ9_9BACT|nr:hypothetical protein [Paraflavisolibacter caeni]MCU7548851.1 hypothetical protein [Paraflavisolibacter caeni]